MTKKEIKRKRYSAEFKINVIMDMRENHLKWKCFTARNFLP